MIAGPYLSFMYVLIVLRSAAMRGPRYSFGRDRRSLSMLAVASLIFFGGVSPCGFLWSDEPGDEPPTRGGSVEIPVPFLTVEGPNLVALTSLKYLSIGRSEPRTNAAL